MFRYQGRENRHQREAEATKHGKPTVATYKPSSPYTWTEPRPDPYSVMSVFCRQNRYLAAGKSEQFYNSFPIHLLKK